MNAQPSPLGATPRKLLHVGCGPSTKRDTTPAFDTPLWHEIRLDINPEVQPDVVGTMLDMQAVPDASIDAIFSSHNIEHLYPHDVPRALSGMRRLPYFDLWALCTKQGVPEAELRALAGNYLPR